MRAASHCIRYLLGKDKPVTVTTERERACLADHVLEKRRALEIGVFEGFNTRFLADRMKQDSELIGVDPFPAGRVGICWSEVIARLEARRSVGARVRLVKALSWDAMALIRGSFDFIFIDGDHSYEAINRDWTDWSARVTPGGVVALHDTTVPDFDPGRARLGSVRYFADVVAHDGRFQLVESVDSLNVLRRRAN
ncbi:MAG: class I SAM-dependent methyltransferase [Propylenella sp.]